MLCQIVVGPLFKTKTISCHIFTCRRASENLTVTLKGKKIVLSIFKGCTLNKICSLACFKAKTEEKTTFFCFPLHRSKTVLKNIKQLLILNFLLGDCSLMYKEGFCKFARNNIHI